MKAQIEVFLQTSMEKILKEQGINWPDNVIFSVERPRDASHGDFSSNIAMVFAKILQCSPRVLAERIQSALPKLENVTRITIAGPGFINFVLAEEFLKKQLESLKNSATCGVEPIATPSRVVVDYSSPNLAKEMHVGHLRSTIIGDAIVRILTFKGYQVIRQNHVGDWGTQFGMLIAHFDDEAKAHSGNLELNNLETFYQAAKKRFDVEPQFAERARHYVVALQSGDEKCLAMWRQFIQLSIAHCQAVYGQLGVALQPSDIRPESAYNEDLPVVVSILKDKGLLVEHDGAQCVFLPEFKGKENDLLPIIVQKKDGAYLYASTDLAAIRYRHQVLNVDRVLYVVDARQALHFQQVFALAKRAGFASDNMLLEHISFGMVLDKSGRPFKSREGGVTKLVDLLNEAQKRAKALIETKQTKVLSAEQLNEMAHVIGVSSIKYADLSKNRHSDYIFDWDSMISFEGNTAPYLLYAFTRIQSIFQKASIIEDQLHSEFIFATEFDIQLAKQLIMFPEVIDVVCLKSTPHLLCTYLYELAGVFSSFYESSPILNQDVEDLKQSRLQLVALTGRILKKGLELLGITTLSRM